MSRFLACWITSVLVVASPVEAADLLSGTWTSGEGTTFVIRHDAIDRPGRQVAASRERVEALLARKR